MRHYITSPKNNVWFNLGVNKFTHCCQSVYRHITPIRTKRPSLLAFINRESIDFSATNDIVADITCSRDIFQVQMDISELNNLNCFSFLTFRILADLIIESINKVVIWNFSRLISEHLLYVFLRIKSFEVILSTKRKNFRTHVPWLKRKCPHVFNDCRGQRIYKAPANPEIKFRRANKGNCGFDYSLEDGVIPYHVNHLSSNPACLTLKQVHKRWLFFVVILMMMLVLSL